MFEQDSALAHQACKMVAFLDRETPDFNVQPAAGLLAGLQQPRDKHKIQYTT